MKRWPRSGIEQSSTTPDPGYHMRKWQKHNKTSQTRAKRSALSQQVATRQQWTDKTTWQTRNINSIIRVWIFFNKNFYGCSLAETSTYVKGLYSVSERLRLNKPSYNQTQTFQKRFLVPGFSSIFLNHGQRPGSMWPRSSMQCSATQKCIHTPKFWIPTSHNIHILSGLYLSRTAARGQGHKDLKTVGGTPWPIDVSTYQIWDYMSHNLEEMLSTWFLYNWGQRPRSKLPKVARYNIQYPDASTQKLRLLPKKNMGYLLGIRCFQVLRPAVKVTVT